MYYKDEQHFMDENGYTIDGRWYPRVTRIVGIKAKPALYRFYASLPSFDAAERMKDKSAEEGTLIHDTAEQIFLGNDPEVPEEIRPAISALQEFLGERSIEIEPEYIEKRIINDTHSYAGTCDALARIDGKFGVLDIKTSLAIYRDYSLQTSAYYYALHEDLPDLETRWILRVDQAQVCRRCGDKLRTKGGREKVRRDRKTASCLSDDHDWGPMRGEVELKEFGYVDQDFRAFLGAKMLWEWDNHYWLRKLRYPMLLTARKRVGM